MNDTDEKKVTIDQVSVNDAMSSDANNAESESSVTAQLDALNTQINELNDKYLRTAAELENTRRRAALDCESAARTRAMSVAEKILPVMDAIDAALRHSPDDAGIISMARAMESAFAQIGIVRIESVGQTLNPMFHNAIQIVDVPADMTPQPAPNTIASEMQPGYMFGDTILRTAMVGVYK